MSKEIELRAPASKSQFEALKQELSLASKAVQTNRCFIDYSTFLEGIGERKLDVRVRITNGTPEFVVKKGLFGGAVREEAIAKVQADSLHGALQVMALLGYTKGVAGGRKILRGTIGEVEVALQEVVDFNDPTSVAEYFIEVEYTGQSDETAYAEQVLLDFLTQRGLTPFSIQHWNEYVSMLNDRWNGVYIHGETPPDLIAKLGS